MRQIDRDTHNATPSLLMADKELSGVEYERAVREMDANFQDALREAYWRGEFPGGAPAYLALPPRGAA